MSDLVSADQHGPGSKFRVDLWLPVASRGLIFWRGVQGNNLPTKTDTTLNLPTEV